MSDCGYSPVVPFAVWFGLIVVFEAAFLAFLVLTHGRRHVRHLALSRIVNNRRSAERLTRVLNDLAEEDLAKAHHGSMSREERLEVESRLKRGELRCVVATGSLELGIDIGSVDLVVCVESPRGVARGLQRVGRSGHLVGQTSKGRIVPKFRGDLVESAAVAQGMKESDVEPTRIPRNPLDVLAQQVVAMSAVDEWDEDALAYEKHATSFSLRKRCSDIRRIWNGDTEATSRTRHEEIRRSMPRAAACCLVATCPPRSAGTGPSDRGHD